MEQLTAYEHALVLTTLDGFPLKRALDSIFKQIPESKHEEVKELIQSFIVTPKVIKTIGREQAISDLIDNEIKTIQEGDAANDHSYINDIFRMGFKGYDNFTDAELEVEYKAQLEEVKIEGE